MTTSNIERSLRCIGMFETLCFKRTDTIGHWYFKDEVLYYENKHMTIEVWVINQ